MTHRASSIVPAVSLATISGLLFAQALMLGNARTLDDTLALPLLQRLHVQPVPRIDLPARIAIPSLRVDAPLQPLSLLPDGTMQTPESADDAGWYALGPRPGEQGSAVIAGHLDSATGPGIFLKLSQLKVKEEIRIVDTGGTVHRFRMTHAEWLDAAEAPDASLFSMTGSPRIVLLTCGGRWEKTKGRYRSRLAVFAEEMQ